MKSSIRLFAACGALTVAGLGLSTGTAFAQYQTITNDVWWKTTSGSPIYAQSGFITKIGSTYYWYGVEYAGAESYYSTGTANSNTAFVGINCYTSTDLVHWSFAATVVSPSSKILTSDYIGRLAGVIKNSSGTYVLWAVDEGSQGDGEMWMTSTSPTGPFTWGGIQTSITNVYDGENGDATIFVDTNHGGTPYFITSDAHGREHAYVCPFGANDESIGAATLITEWPQGQEADCMFYSTGTSQYYLCTSQLAGWSYSYAYQIGSSSIYSGYYGDTEFTGTVSNYTHYSQISFFYNVVGSEDTTYLLACDRWADFSSNYKNAGYPNGYYVWQPVSASGSAYKNNPTFWNLTSWQLNVTTGHWED
jgi:Glycosyl hydrolases family 43